MISATTLKQPKDRNTVFLPLAGYLEIEFPILYRYLGDVAFGKLVREFVAANPILPDSQDAQANGMLLFLKHQLSFQHNPEVYELARLECAANAAFISAEHPVLSAREFEEIENADLAKLKIRFVDSAQLLIFRQNTTSIWAAMKCEERPPKPHLLDEPQNVSVWKQRGAPRFRLLGAEEAMLFEKFKQKLNVKAAAKLLQNGVDFDQAIARVLNYIRGWVDAELVLRPAEALLK